MFVFLLFCFIFIYSPPPPPPPPFVYGSVAFTISHVSVSLSLSLSPGGGVSLRLSRVPGFIVSSPERLAQSQHVTVTNPFGDHAPSCLTSSLESECYCSAPLTALSTALSDRLQLREPLTRWRGRNTVHSF